jgi:hypothetical protein
MGKGWLQTKGGARPPLDPIGVAASHPQPMGVPASHPLVWGWFAATPFCDIIYNII